MPDDFSDVALLERAGRGDETAFVLLYERHRDTVFRFSWRMLGQVEAAEDVTHDCFLGLLAHPERYDPSRASLRTYLCAAARNQVLKRLRDGGREIGEADASEIAADNGPLSGLLAGEATSLVGAAIAALPPLQREALVLVEYEEMSLAQVADTVGADVGTVKSRLHRARAGLRLRLEALGARAEGGKDAGRE